MNLVQLSEVQRELIYSFKTIPQFDGMVTSEPGFPAVWDPQDQAAITTYRGQLLSLCVELENELVLLSSFSEVGEFGNELNNLMNQRAKSGFVSKKSTFVKWYKKSSGKTKTDLLEFVQSVDYLNTIRDAIAHHSISGFKCKEGLIPFVFNGRETIIFEKSCIDKMQDCLDQLYSHFGVIRSELELPLTNLHLQAMSNSPLD